MWSSVHGNAATPRGAARWPAGRRGAHGTAGKSHYQVLGVSRAADRKEIRRAYLRAAKLRHPDQGGTSEDFQRVNRAYTVLYDSDLRAQYDASGERPDFDAVMDAQEEARQEARERERRWEEKLRAHQRAAAQRRGQSPGGMPFGGQQDFVMYDIDAWERAHGLGRYGNGPEAVHLGYDRFYVDETRARDRLRRAEEEGAETKHSAFFRRQRERQRRKAADQARAAAAAAAAGRRSRDVHTWARAPLLQLLRVLPKP